MKKDTDHSEDLDFKIQLIVLIFFAIILYISFGIINTIGYIASNLITSKFSEIVIKSTEDHMIIGSLIISIGFTLYASLILIFKKTFENFIFFCYTLLFLLLFAISCYMLIFNNTVLSYNTTQIIIKKD